MNSRMFTETTGASDLVTRRSRALQRKGAVSRPIALTNARIVTPLGSGVEECIVIDGGEIVAIAPLCELRVPDNAQEIDVGGRLVTPGFIDLHLHGGDGCSFNESDDGSFDRIVGHHVAHGTTSLLATLYVDEEDKLLSAVEKVADHIISRDREPAIIKGIHLEGPFVNPGMSGAMDGRFVWEPDCSKWRSLEDAAKGTIKMMTVAPELPGMVPIMRDAVRAGVRLAVGHSEASYSDVESAIANGATQVTHIFNAMRPMHHRDPGIVGAALLKRELNVHLIADGMHVHPAVMKALYKTRGSDGITLITDASAANSEENSVYEMAGRTVTVNNSRACLNDGTLAGSALTMSKAVETMVREVGIPLDEAIRMSTLNPARALGLDDAKGTIAVGKDADIVVLNSDLTVHMTLLGGRIVYSEELQSREKRHRHRVGLSRWNRLGGHGACVAADIPHSRTNTYGLARGT